MSPLDVVIPTRSVEAVAGLASRPFGPLSPFFGLTPARDDAGLQGSGLLTDSGSVGADAIAALATLSRPDALGGFLYARGPLVREGAIYHGPFGPVSMINTREGLRLTHPGSGASVVQGLARSVAASAVRAVPLDADLSFAEAIVLFAAIDLERRAALARLAGVVPTIVDMSAASVVRWITEAGREPQWLTPHLIASTGAPVPEAPALAAALTSLASTGLIGTNGADDRGPTIVGSLARWLPVVGSLLRVTAARLGPDGTPLRVEIRAVLGSPDPIVVWQPLGPRGVHVRCASGPELISLVRPLLEDPGALAAYVDRPVAASTRTDPPPPSAGSIRRFCAQCGEPLSAGARFCGSCGREVSR